MKYKYPMQPIHDGRFESNPIVDWLCTEVSNMNDIAHYCAENDIAYKYQEQLAQLVGYSVGGYASLSYVSDDSYNRAENQMNIDKVETQTEHQEGMSAFSGEVEWNGEGLPPAGAIYTTEPNFDIELLCKYSSEYVVIGEVVDVPEVCKGVEVVIDIKEQRNRAFRKPETPQQREDRERLEAAYDLYTSCAHAGGCASFEIFVSEPVILKFWLSVVDKTNYRKGVK